MKAALQKDQNCNYFFADEPSLQTGSLFLCTFFRMKFLILSTRIVIILLFYYISYMCERYNVLQILITNESQGLYGRGYSNGRKRWSFRMRCLMI